MVYKMDTATIYTMKDGKAEGEWREYDSSGGMVSCRIYHEGNEIGECRG